MMDTSTKALVTATALYCAVTPMPQAAKLLIANRACYSTTGSAMFVDMGMKLAHTDSGEAELEQQIAELEAILTDDVLLKLWDQHVIPEKARGIEL